MAIPPNSNDLVSAFLNSKRQEDPNYGKLPPGRFLDADYIREQCSSVVSAGVWEPPRSSGGQVFKNNVYPKPDKREFSVFKFKG